MEKQEAVGYLSSLLDKTLRITISDRRTFVGQMKCTDKGRNIILANTHEYREPSETALKVAADDALSKGKDKVVADMTSRFVGLIVVPGEHIRKIELEEYDPSSGF